MNIILLLLCITITFIKKTYKYNLTNKYPENELMHINCILT